MYGKAGSQVRSDAENVSQYLQEAPAERRDALGRLRKLCAEELAGYEESMAYGMPSYAPAGGEVAVAFASQKHYISLYILKTDVLDKHRAALQGHNLGKGCISYTKPEKIDFDLVKQLLVDSVHSEGTVC